MFDEHPESGGGEIAVKVKVKAKAKVKPLTRAQRLVAWRKANEAAYVKACDAHCTCTPSRAQMLLIQKWHDPQID
jgi:hypothetical protein